MHLEPPTTMPRRSSRCIPIPALLIAGVLSGMPSAAEEPLDLDPEALAPGLVAVYRPAGADGAAILQAYRSSK